MSNAIINAGDVSKLENVTNIMVARFETDLIKNKKQLEKEIRETKDSLKATKDRLSKHAEDQAAENKPTIPGYEKLVKVKTSEASINFKDKEVTVSHTIETKKDRYHNSISFSFVYCQDDKDFEVIEKIEVELKALKSKLQTVMAELGGIGRKERQLRGALAERALGEDVEALLQDAELSEMVTLQLEG